MALFHKPNVIWL